MEKRIRIIDFMTTTISLTQPRVSETQLWTFGFIRWQVCLVSGLLGNFKRCDRALMSTITGIENHLLESLLGNNVFGSIHRTLMHAKR
jgi:hypothetical protein